MSTPPGAAAAAPARAPARENVFTHKIGPLPMWGWLLIAIALVLGYSYYKNKTSTGTQTATDTTNASQVPQFVNQTYTTVNPPSSPSTTGGGTSSTGTVTVPSVVGMGDTEADTAITAAGLKVKDANEPKGGFGKNIGEYTVSSQSPGGGSQAAPGSIVTLTFAKKGSAPNPGGTAKKPTTKHPKPKPGGKDKGEG